MDTDILQIEGPRKLYTLNQKTRVFGPTMPPPRKENCETTSHIDIMELTQPQCGDDEREKERKKNRNKRRIQKRHKKVIVGYFLFFILELKFPDVLQESVVTYCMWCCHHLHAVSSSSLMKLLGETDIMSVSNK